MPRRTLAFLLPAVVLLTALCGLVYVEVQQDLRTGANDPQVQLAEDAVAALNAGAAPASVAAGQPVDLARSLAPFVAIYDSAGTVLASNGTLGGDPPRPPAGVLASAASTGRDVVTWQPQAGVRIALVVLPWRDGTVAAGRSLRLVEERESQALQIAAAAWIAGCLALVVASAVAARLWPAAAHSAAPPSADRP